MKRRRGTSRTAGWARNPVNKSVLARACGRASSLRFSPCVGSTTGLNNLFANLGTFTFALLLGALKDATISFSVGFGLVTEVCVVGLVFTAAPARVRSDALRVLPATFFVTM